MNKRASKALSVIRRCVVDGRYIVLPHFAHRMDERGLVWSDLLAVLDNPDRLRDEGYDQFDRPKWLISGTAADGLPVEIICVLDRDKHGNITVFITLYWSDAEK